MITILCVIISLSYRLIKKSSKAKTQKGAILTAMEEYIRLRKSEKIADQLCQFENFFSGTDLKKMREDK
jgi:hypothetical protein